jgi:hypothetical protein
VLVETGNIRIGAPPSTYAWFRGYRESSSCSKANSHSSFVHGWDKAMYTHDNSIQETSTQSLHDRMSHTRYYRHRHRLEGNLSWCIHDPHSNFLPTAPRLRQTELDRKPEVVILIARRHRRETGRRWRTQDPSLRTRA